MGPQRTFPPVKAIKTERTHEENQERAYIAASRRSDRSLEARVESARRASEIHKRRTGRSLRVTEQDVINEEMYEEEDDDLPSQYRRLTAHLQTGSVEFNRRLANYLTNHVAMRTALNDAIHGNFTKHYPNAPHFAHNQGGTFPSPIVTQGYPQQPQQQQNPMHSPLSATSPRTPHHQYRTAPYSFPSQGYRPQIHQRSASMALPSGMQNAQVLNPTPVTPGGPDFMSGIGRRMSVPGAKVDMAEMPTAEPFPSPKSEAPLKRERSAEAAHAASKPSSAPASVANASSPPQQPAGAMSPPQPRQGRPTNIPNFPKNSLAPFSMALPMDTQQILNPAALPHDDFGAALMAGHEAWSMDGFGASDPGQMIKLGSNFYPNSAGMSATLAPEDVFKSAQHQSSMGIAPVSLQGDGTGPLNAYDFNQFVDFNAALGGSSNDGSANATPGLEASAWDSYIDSSWGEGVNPT